MEKTIENNIRKDIIRSIRAVNRFLTEKHLSTLSNKELLANVHPLYRDEYKYKFRKAKEEKTTENV